VAASTPQPAQPAALPVAGSSDILKALGVGILINFIGIDPIKALIYSAIANGIVAPVIIIFIVHISGSKKVMGHFKNKTGGNILGWIIALLMSVTAIAAIYSLF
jgi:Mn2+/Fe2+ NRAMP family transporter